MLQGDKAHLFQVLRELRPGLFTGFSTESVDKFSRESRPQMLLASVKAVTAGPARRSFPLKLFRSKRKTSLSTTCNACGKTIVDAPDLIDT